MSRGSLGGKGFGGEWTHACVWLSLFTAHLKLPQQSLLAIPQCEINRNKKKIRGVTTGPPCRAAWLSQPPNKADRGL